MNRTEIAIELETRAVLASEILERGKALVREGAGSSVAANQALQEAGLPAIWSLAYVCLFKVLSDNPDEPGLPAGSHRN
jgi:hypothetical protein